MLIVHIVGQLARKSKKLTQLRYARSECLKLFFSLLIGMCAILKSNVTIHFIFSFFAHSVEIDLTNINTQNTMMDAHTFMHTTDPFALPEFEEAATEAECVKMIQGVSKLMGDVQNLYNSYYKKWVKKEGGTDDKSDDKDGDKGGDKGGNKGGNKGGKRGGKKGDQKGDQKDDEKGDENGEEKKEKKEKREQVDIETTKIPEANIRFSLYRDINGLKP